MDHNLVDRFMVVASGCGEPVQLPVTGIGFHLAIPLRRIERSEPLAQTGQLLSTELLDLPLDLLDSAHGCF